MSFNGDPDVYILPRGGGSSGGYWDYSMEYDPVLGYYETVQYVP